MNIIQKHSLKKASHTARAIIKKNSVVHINIHLDTQINTLNMRKKDFFTFFKQAIKNAREKGLRIVHYALLNNHIHLMVEADDNKQVAVGMQSFNITLYRFMKKFLQKNKLKKLWHDRYHMRILRTPTEIKNALKYIITNPTKHGKSNTIFDLFTSIFSLEENNITTVFGDQSHLPPPFFAALCERFNSSMGQILFKPTTFLLNKVLGNIAY